MVRNTDSVGAMNAVFEGPLTEEVVASIAEKVAEPTTSRDEFLNLQRSLLGRESWRNHVGVDRSSWVGIYWATMGIAQTRANVAGTKLPATEFELRIRPTNLLLTRAYIVGLRIGEYDIASAFDEINELDTDVGRQNDLKPRTKASCAPELGLASDRVWQFANAFAARTAQLRRDAARAQFADSRDTALLHALATLDTRASNATSEDIQRVFTPEQQLDLPHDFGTLRMSKLVSLTGAFGFFAPWRVAGVPVHYELTDHGKRCERSALLGTQVGMGHVKKFASLPTQPNLESQQN